MPDPLFLDIPLDELRAPVEVKALVGAGRHLHLDHGIPAEAITDVSGHHLLVRHLDEHDLPLDAEDLRHLIPFDVASGVHRLAAGEADDGRSAGFRLAGATPEEILAAVQRRFGFAKE